ncbi:uncharacterized protein EURHEDRAFT_445506, partial [Aspergillus ruber CBS 135680]
SAFIAASRRKDRSLDARLESANRASMLHKKRTGKSLHITKDIVEKEAMYEEVDERYQEKRIRMLQAQNMQIEEQLNRQLLTALAARNHRGSTSRATSMAPRASIDGVRKMSLDLSSVRSSFSEGMQTGALNSPMITENRYTMSPDYNTIASPQHTQPEWYNQVPAYVQQMQWPQQWTGFQPQQEQPHVMQDYVSQMPMNVAATRPFRDRFASAPEIPLHGMPTNSFSLMSAPAPVQQEQPLQQSQHSRVQSEPNMSMAMMMHNLQQQQAQSQQPISKPASPKTQPTPDAYSSPSTPPQSPKTTSVGVGTMGVPQPDVKTIGKNDDGVLFAQELDPDFDEFSQFALGLGNTTEISEREPFGFEDFVTMDDFTAAA